jgi:ubiquinone/menaquinone biosynthesis C-methylase UbiE
MGARTAGNVAYYDALAANYGLFFSDMEESMQVEGRWLAGLLHAHGCRTVLDASCGSGRQSVPLCEHGFEVVASDPSEAMLREAQAVAADHKVRLPLLQADFATLPRRVDRQFDAVIALGNGLCNLETSEAIQEALEALHSCCRPGGICVIGIKDFERVKSEGQRFHGHRVVDSDDTRTLLFEVWDFEESILISNAYLVRQERSTGESRVVSAETREYMLGQDELRAIGSAVGFRSITRVDHPSEAAFVLIA